MVTFVAVLAHTIAGSLFDGVAVRRITIILISATLSHVMPGKTSVKRGGTGFTDAHKITIGTRDWGNILAGRRHVRIQDIRKFIIGCGILLF